MQNWDTRKFQKILSDNGYERIRTSGGHIVYSNGTDNISITANKLNGCIAKKIIKEKKLCTH